MCTKVCADSECIHQLLVEMDLLAMGHLTGFFETPNTVSRTRSRSSGVLWSHRHQLQWLKIRKRKSSGRWHGPAWCGSEFQGQSQVNLFFHRGPGMESGEAAEVWDAVNKVSIYFSPTEPDAGKHQASSGVAYEGPWSRVVYGHSPGYNHIARKLVEFQVWSSLLKSKHLLRKSDWSLWKWVGES